MLRSILETGLKESFDSVAPYKKMDQSEDGIVKYSFEIGEKKYIVSFDIEYSMGLDFWNFYFALLNGNRENLSNTGTGDQFIVFSTVINILNDFILTIMPDMILFSGDMRNGRDKFYEKMLGFLKPKLLSKGYTFSKRSQIDNDQYFAIEKIANKNSAKNKSVNESFNSAVRFNCRNYDSLYSYDFEVNGKTYESEFSYDGEFGTENGDWDFSFGLASDGFRKYNNTGTGDQLIVFSTIMNILKDFIDRVGPDRIVFTGSKEDHRDKLYTIMLNRSSNALKSLGYSWKVKDTHLNRSFEIFNTNQINESSMPIPTITWEESREDSIAKFSIDGQDCTVKFVFQNPGKYSVRLEDPNGKRINLRGDIESRIPDLANMTLDAMRDFMARRDPHVLAIPCPSSDRKSQDYLEMLRACVEMSGDPGKYSFGRPKDMWMYVQDGETCVAAMKKSDHTMNDNSYF